MPTVVRLGVTVLIALMVAVEIAEDHSVHIVLLGIALLAWALHSHFGAERRRVALLAAIVVMLSVCGVGYPYWFDGSVDWLDALYGAGAVSVGLAVAAAVWGLLAPT